MILWLISRKLTDTLLERINDNLRQKRQDEVRRAMLILIKEFYHLRPLDAQKSQAAILLEGLRELGNRVAPAGQFDREIDEIYSKYKIRKGLRSETLPNYPDFIDIVKQLPRRLTVDSTIELMQAV